MAAVIATIVAAILVGLFVSSLNPTESSVGRATPSPVPTDAVTPSPTAEPTEEATPSPTPEPTPELPGTLAFGSELDANNQVVETVETFTPSMNFAYSVAMPDGFGAPQIGNEVVRIEEDGTSVVLEREPVDVDPAATSFGYVIGQAGTFITAWGPGEYEWRVYVEDEIIARGRFQLAEG
jgi:hypothetical protein